MKRTAGRTLKSIPVPHAGSRAFLLPALTLNLFFCVCLSAQTVNLPLPYPIPPPAEDPQPVRQKPAVSAPASTPAEKPASTTTASTPAEKPASTTTASTSQPVQQKTASSSTAANNTGGSNAPILVNPKPLRDISGKIIPMNGAYGGGSILLPAAYTAKQNEFRGVWVATAYNLDFAKQTTAAEFQTSYRSLVARIAALGFNTIMFQVRPSCDAFYKSSVNPWSRWLTGEEGKALDGGFDPLQFMIAEAHRRGLKFYAWLNPYRIGQMASAGVSTASYLRTLSAGNFARRNPELVARWNDTKGGRTFFFLDPGRSEVVKHVSDTVREILQNYRPDGIVFDDHFYPIGCDTACDAATYRKYAKKGQSLDDWRRANTELMIRTVSGTVRAFNRLNGTSIPFGVSPVGIWANRSKAMPEGSPSTKGVEAYTQSYIDVRKWVKNSWIDFVIPQVNWGFANERAPFAGIVNWWADLVRGTKVKLYIGIGVYQAGVAAGMESPSELSNQVLYLILRREVSGTALFAARHCFSPENRAQKTSLQTIFGSYWRKSSSPASGK